MAVTMRNVVFRDIKAQFVLHGRHIRSPLQSFHGRGYEESRLVRYYVVWLL
jgi:hypothetical protein